MGGTIPSPVCCDGPPAAAGAFDIGHVSVCCAPATTASRSTCTATQSTIPLIRAFRCPVSPTSLIRDAAMASPAARRSAENSAAACLRNPALIIRRCRGRGRRLTMAPMTGGVPRNVEVRARPPPETVQPAPREGALQPHRHDLLPLPIAAPRRSAARPFRHACFRSPGNYRVLMRHAARPEPPVLLQKRQNRSHKRHTNIGGFPRSRENHGYESASATTACHRADRCTIATHDTFSTHRSKQA
jgi:hypothetical protein